MIKFFIHFLLNVLFYKNFSFSPLFLSLFVSFGSLINLLVDDFWVLFFTVSGFYGLWVLVVSVSLTLSLSSEKFLT